MHDVCRCNGDVYEGSWEHNVACGQGKKTLSDGSVYEGAFEGGKARGWGRKVYPDGEEYAGEYIDDVREGYAVLNTLLK